MNKVILMGRLTREPDIRMSQGNGESFVIARFTLAVDRRRTSPDGQREADFISCVTFGKSAEFAQKYLHTGTKIALHGRIQTGSYTKQDGQKVYTTDVVAEELEFAESKAAADMRQGGAPQYRTPYQNQNPYQQGMSGGYAQQAPRQAAPQAPAPVKEEAPAPVNEGFMPAPEDPAEDPAITDAVLGTEGFTESEVGKGFMDIPQGVEDDKLPFN